MALTILHSPYAFEEVRVKDKYEVFSVPQVNLLDMAGVWAGFDGTWLVSEIVWKLKRYSTFAKIEIRFDYRLFRWIHKTN